MKWLSEKGELKDRWAARFTWASATFGVHSTQRNESMNAIIKKMTKSSGGLVLTLIKTVAKYQRAKNNDRCVRVSVR